MHRSIKPNYLLRGALAVLGLVIVVLGLNVGFGGIRTLGWQGGLVDFLTVTDPGVYAVRDNHVRFIGGVWLGLGLVVLAGSVAFQRLRGVLVVLVGLIAIGGLARFSGDLSSLVRPDILPSLVFELLGAPLLALWFARAERPRPPVN